MSLKKLVRGCFFFVLPPPPTGQPKEQKMGGGKGNSGNEGGSDPETAPMMQTDVPSYREMLICR